MKHDITKCRVCDNYLAGLDTCKYCKFEWRRDYPPTSDYDFDILDLDDDTEWSHHQILDRLHYKGIECLMADIWTDNNIAWLVGVKADESTVASALGIHEDVIYPDWEHGWMILNLFQEKYIRGDLDEEESI